ncbi:uncharacterized protein LOC141900414 [Tubulanus polymorphus]|uniref:uncharacterized protein LOC141900414 n=1 Tax=Tubulanus polymorphus TaxID=672921 RepID=UPI003DA2B3EA
MASGWTKRPWEKAIEETFIFIRAYVTIPLICIGIFGNGMSILIFLQTRKSKDSASVQYLSALAVSDTMNLALYGLTEWFRSGAKDASSGKWSFEILAKNGALCKICRYLSFISFHLSSWIIVTFAAERLVAVWFPLKSTRLISCGRRRRIIIFLVVSTMLMKLPYLHLYEIHQVHRNVTATCFYDKTKWKYGYLYTFIDFFVATFLPCVLLCLVNLAITIGVIKSKKAVKIRSATCNEQRRAMENKCIVNLLIVSSLFVVLEIPYVVVWMMYFIMSRPGQSTIPDEDYVMFIFKLAKLFSSFKMLNYSLNFIVYTLSLDFYRRKFKRLLCCCCLSSVNVTKFPRIISSLCDNRSSIERRSQQSIRANHDERFSNASLSSGTREIAGKAPTEFQLCTQCCSLRSRKHRLRSTSLVTQDTLISSRNGPATIQTSRSCSSLISNYNDWDNRSVEITCIDTPVSAMNDVTQELQRIADDGPSAKQLTENDRTLFMTKF